VSAYSDNLEAMFLDMMSWEFL